MADTPVDPKPGIKTTEGWATLIVAALSAIAIAVNMRAGHTAVPVDNDVLAGIAGGVVGLYTLARTAVKVFVGR